jgi:hypothetical protein
MGIAEDWMEAALTATTTPDKKNSDLIFNPGGSNFILASVR